MAERTSTRLEGALVIRGLIAGALAWLAPGAGHLYTGARRRAAVFFALVALTLLLGLVFDGNFAVADPRAPVLTRLQVAANLSLGPVEPLLRTSLYGTLVYVNAPPPRRGLAPEVEQALERREQRFFRTWSSYGTAYLMAASLMNVLLILDAWDIAIGRKR
jgi:hypothetical protein